jgi:hypothetical protein
LSAGARAGKTYAAAREFVKRIYQDRAAKRGHLRYWVVAPTYQLVDVARREISTILSGEETDYPIPGKLVKSWNKTTRILELNGAITITFKGAHKPETLVAEGLDGLWCDEPARMKPDAWRGQLRMRLSDRAGWALFSTTPLGKNWYYTDIFLRGCPESESYDPQYENFRFRTVDNTSRPGLVAEVEKARRELPKAYFEREYEASFDAFHGQIFDELCDEIHLVDSIPDWVRFERYSVGVDFGWNLGAATFNGIDQFNNWWQFDELQMSKVPIITDDHNPKTWAKILDEKFRGLKKSKDGIWVWCDTENPEGIQSFRRANWPDYVTVRGAEKAVYPGISHMAAMLHPINGQPRLKILRSCTKSYEQYRGYYWDDKNDNFIDKPAPGQIDHCVDSERYSLFSDFKRFGEVGDLRPVKYAGY